MPRWLTGSLTRDGLLATVVLVVEVFAAARGRPRAAAGVDAVALLPVPMWFILLIGSAALLWRRDRPLVVLAVVLAGVAGWHLLGYDGAPSLAVLVAGYGIGRYVTNQVIALVALAVMAATFAAVGFLAGDPLLDIAVAATVLPLLPWYVGRRVAARRDRLRLLRERATLLEREREAAVRRAREEERTGIARELHDVVAHRVSLMTVQAGAAQAVLTRDPDRAARAMAAVEDAGRAALDELRHLLGVLGSPSGPRPGAPQATVADVPALCQQLAAAGLAVSLDMEQVASDLPARVDLSAFRIVQESLTNTLRHAGPGARATVSLAVEDGRLRVEISDDGNGRPVAGAGGGRGLAGMRERVDVLGGLLEAGPRVGGGFRVRATLPLTRPQP